MLRKLKTKFNFKYGLIPVSKPKESESENG
jgi:hypothetical protein